MRAIINFFKEKKNIKSPIICNSHGTQETTYVCQHIAYGLESGQSMGFYWAASEDDERPDAWCSACEKYRVENGGDWNDDFNDFVKVSVLCGSCYDFAKAQNGF